jgi:hypothetical protein
MFEEILENRFPMRYTTTIRMCNIVQARWWKSGDLEARRADEIIAWGGAKPQEWVWSAGER